MPADLDYPYVWTRSILPAGYKGQECKILSRKSAPAALGGTTRKSGRVTLPPGVVHVEFRNGLDYRVQEKYLEKVA